MSEPDTIPKSLLVIGYTWPEPNATAAGQRIMWLLQGFLQKGYQITFASTAGPGAYEADLVSLGIEKVRIRLNDTSFDRFLSARSFSLILFDRFLTEEQFIWRIRDCLPNARLLMDTEDLHSLRYSREEAVRKGRVWRPSDWVRDPRFYREIASLFRADLNLIISKPEMELLTGQVPLLRSKLVYVPFGSHIEEQGKVQSFDGRSDFVFIGNGKHRPNLDAILQLKGEIWPRIRSLLPKGKLQIYGAYLPEHILQLHTPEEGFEVKGWAPDLKTVFGKARVQIAPLRFGAGVKGKVLEAARHGLPTMGTSMAFEGILNTSGKVAFSADTADDFARKAVHLYNHVTVWERALSIQKTEAAKHHMTTFSPLTKALEMLEKPIEVVPEETRILENMLRDEAFGRVRYLSKWIEAKEKGED